MDTQNPSILDVLNASCGDVLKAHVLNLTHGFNINLISVRAPAGDAEKAFAVSRAKLVEDAPQPKSADKLLADFKKDAAKPVPVETLPKMPAAVKFEDREPMAKPVIAVVPTDSEWVTLGQAAELRGVGLAGASATSRSQGWKTTPHPTNRHQKLYLKSDVLAGRAHRKAA